MEREYFVQGKTVHVTVEVIRDKPSFFFIRIKADKETLKNYVGEGEIQFGIYIDDILTAIKEALDEVVRD